MKWQLTIQTSAVINENIEITALYISQIYKNSTETI